MKSNLVLMICGFIAASLAGDVLAQSGHAPHTHGEGELSIVVDGNALVIDVSLPGADVVGFEHKAEHEADINAVRNAMKKLMAVGNLFQFQNSAGCEVVEAEADSSLIDGAEGHGHGDFVAHYAFRCASPNEIDGLTVKLFQVFPSLHELHAVVVTGSTQSATTLKPDENILRFVN